MSQQARLTQSALIGPAHAGKFAKIGRQYRLRAAPHQKKHALPNGAFGSVPEHKPGSLGGCQPGLGGPQDERIRLPSNDFRYRSSARMIDRSGKPDFVDQIGRFLCKRFHKFPQIGSAVHFFPQMSQHAFRCSNGQN